MFLQRLTFLILFLGSALSGAESSLLIRPRWSGCNFGENKTCYTLDAEEGATSYFSNNFYIRNIHLKIFESRNNNKPVQEISAEQAFFGDFGQTLYIMNSPKGDYVFKIDQGILRPVF